MNPDATNTAPEKLPRRRGRRFLSRLLTFVSVVLLLIAVVVVIGATPFGRNRITQLVLNNIPVADNHQFSFSRTEGSIVQDLTVFDLRFVDPSGSELLAIDTVTVSVHLLPLLSKTIAIKSLDIRGPRVHASQTPNGTWDIVDAFPVDTTSSGIAIRIGSAMLRNGSVAAQYRSEGGDSTLTASDILIAATDMAMVDRYAIDLHELHATFVPPGLSEPAFVRLKARIGDGSVRIDTLLLTSPRTSLHAVGRTLVAGGDESLVDRVHDANLTLSATPVSFADLAPFFPGIDPDAVGSIEASATGSPDDLQFSLDADFEQNGSLTASGRAVGMTRRFDSERNDSLESTIQLDATIDNLRASLFDRVRFERDDLLSGSINADLSGDDRYSLSGVLDVALQETRVRSIRIAQPKLRAVFDNGSAEYDGSVFLAGQPLRLSGHTRPFDAVPTYTGMVAFQSFDVSRLAATLADWPTRLNGTLRIDGSGLENPSVNATAELQNSTIKRLGVRKAMIASSLNGDEATFSVDADGSSGKMSATGKAVSLENETWELTHFSVSDLNVSALLDDTTSIVLTASGSLSGSGFSADDLSFEGTAQVDSASYAAYKATGLVLDLNKTENTITFREEGIIQGAKISSSGRVDLGRVPRIIIADGAVANLDVGAFVADQSSDVNGTFKADLRGTELAQLAGEISAQLTESSFNETTIRSGTIAATIQAGTIDFELDVTTPSGQLAVAGQTTPFDEVPTVRLSRSTIRGIDVGALAGLPDVHTRINGSLEGDIQGASLAGLRGAAVLRLDSTIVNGIDGINGTMHLDASDTLVTIQTELNWQGGGTANGLLARRPAIDTTADPEYRAEVTLNHFDVGSWIGKDTVSSDVSAEFSGTFSGRTLATMTGSGELSRLVGQYQELSVSQGTGSFSLNDGILTLRSVAIISNAGTLLAGGTAAIRNSAGAGESNLSIDVQIKTLKPIASIIPSVGSLDGSGSVLAQLTGPAQSLFASGQVHLESIEYKERRVAKIDAQVDASFNENRNLTMFDATTEILNVILPTATVREITLHSALVDSVFQFEGVSAIDDRRSAQLSGTLDIRPGAQSVLVDDFSIRLDKDRWMLLQPSLITYGDGVRVKNLLLYTSDQQIALDGIVDLNGNQSLILTVENFRIESIADLFDYSGLGGTVNGYLDLTGPAEAPIIEGELGVDVVSNKSKVGDMQLSLRYDSLLLYNDAVFRHVDGSTLTITGKLPVDLRLARGTGPSQTGVRVAARQALPDTQVNIQVEADSFAMGWMLPFLDKQVYDRLGGKIDGRFDVSGTVRNPALSGALFVLNADIGLPTFGIHPNKINADLELDGNEIHILRAEGSSGSGSVTAIGEVTLSELTLGQFDISLSMENFLAMDNATFRDARTSGDLLLYGSTLQPNVSGYLRMEGLDIYYASAIEDFEPVQLTEQDLRDVERVFGRRVTEADTTTFSFYKALQMDINLEMERDSWLRSKQNPRMNIEFTGDMDLQKNPNEEERMFGTINVLPERSTIDQFGRRFDITSGTVTYNGDFDNPLVDIAATYTVKSPTDRNAEVVISLKATGQLDNLQIELNSDPQMELTDILSYILTGRPAGESLQFSSGEAGIATDIALSQATGYLEGLAGSELGLDVVRIENDGSEIKLTAGKYIRNGVYLAISQPVVLSSSASGTNSQETNRPEFTVEVEVIKDLLARLLQQGSGFRLTLYWKHAY